MLPPRLALLLVLPFVLLTGCAALVNETFTFDDRYGYGYLAELNPVELFGSLEVDPSAPPPTLVPGERLLLVQSGAERPHPALLEAFSERYDVVVTGGLPFGIARRPQFWATPPKTFTAEYGRSLQGAARSLGVDKVLIVWQRLDLRRESNLGALIGWFPIFDFLIPMFRTEGSIGGTLLLVDAPTGRSTPILTEDLNDVAHVRSTLASFGNDLKKLAEEVKAAAYPAWAEQAAEAFAP